MAFVKIMVHSVWATKNHFPFLKKEILHEIISHIKENARTKRIFIECINGTVDHLHCLLGLNSDMSISKTIQLIKGESSNWMNKHKLTKSKFEWADEYYAVSVSESDLIRVRKYIDMQEEHHKKILFSDECNLFLKDYLSDYG